jgi:hypothetical protein
VTDQVHEPSKMLDEAASLIQLMGGIAPRHLVIVGGLVPPLLCPRAAEPHLGSADVDLCLSVAITKGQTSEYYRSVEQCIEPYFESIGSGFRWRKREGVGGVPLLVDFLGPEVEATPLDDGTLRLEEDTAAENTGARLRPFPLAAAELVDADAMASTIEGVRLIYRPGVRADVEIRHAGPVGFLASKADALASRDDPKDGYDISWWCLHAASSAEEVAAVVTARPRFEDPYFQESVAKLESAFRAPDYVGPSGYARERTPNLSPGDGAYDSDCNAAYAIVSGVVRRLRDGLWK